MSEPSADEGGHADRESTSRSLPSRVFVPGDLLLVLGFVVLADTVLYTVPTSAVVPRTVVGLPLLFFVPGYVVVAVLFPGCKRSDRATGGWQDLVSGSNVGATIGIDWPERLALSVGASVAVLPPYALVLAVAGVPYTAAVVAASVSVLVVGGVTVATVYRNRLPPDEQFGLPLEQVRTVVADGTRGQPSALDAGINVVVALVVLGSLLGVGYAIAAPNNAASFTTVALLSPEGDEAPAAAGYPETVPANGSDFVLEVTNNEGAPVSYTAVVELQRVETDGEGVDVLERREVARLDRRVEANGTWRARHRVQPALPGEERRLVYYLYRDEVPATPSTDSAYRHVSIWVDVSGNSSEPSSPATAGPS